MNSKRRSRVDLEERLKSVSTALLVVILLGFLVNSLMADTPQTGQGPLNKREVQQSPKAQPESMPGAQPGPPGTSRTYKSKFLSRRELTA